MKNCIGEKKRLVSKGVWDNHGSRNGCRIPS
jgi:hypothetical protein